MSVSRRRSLLYELALGSPVWRSRRWVVRDERPALRPVPAAAGPARWRRGDGNGPPSDVRPAWAGSAEATSSCCAGLAIAARTGGGIGGRRRRVKRHGCCALMSGRRERDSPVGRRGADGVAVIVMGRGVPRIVPHPSPLPGARRSSRRPAKVSIEGSMEIGTRGTLAPVGTPVDAYRSVADGRSGNPFCGPRARPRSPRRRTSGPETRPARGAEAAASCRPQTSTHLSPPLGDARPAPWRDGRV